MNIWFLRMDKYTLEEDCFSGSDTFIHSAHGSCGNVDIAKKHKGLFFPKLTKTGKELAKLIREIKEKLIEDDHISLEQSGKRRCDIAIRYWLSVMQIGDLVFIRNKQDKVVFARVTGYICEDFFDSYGCFKRPVEIISQINEQMIPAEIWRRTKGRKTIERNAKKHITDWITNNYESLVNNA